MREELANWLNVHGDYFTLFSSALIPAICLAVALSLLNKKLYKFLWRRVWAIYFVSISILYYLKLFIEIRQGSI